MRIIPLLLLLTGCAYYGPSDSDQFAFSDRVQYSSGGRIVDTLRALDRAQDSGHKLVIDGVCESACTLATLYDNVCWTRRSMFRFHGARVNGKQSDAATAGMVALFPRKAQIEIFGGLRFESLSPDTFINVDGVNMARIMNKDNCS